MLICGATHLVPTAVASAGPTPDIDTLEGLMNHVPRALYGWRKSRPTANLSGLQ